MTDPRLTTHGKNGTPDIPAVGSRAEDVSTLLSLECLLDTWRKRYGCPDAVLVSAGRPNRRWTLSFHLATGTGSGLFAALVDLEQDLERRSNEAG